MYVVSESVKAYQPLKSTEKSGKVWKFKMENV